MPHGRVAHSRKLSKFTLTITSPAHITKKVNIRVGLAMCHNFAFLQKFSICDSLSRGQTCGFVNFHLASSLILRI